MTDFFSVTSSALPSGARVVAFRGTEALSALYGFEIHLFIEDPAFDPATALGAGATFSIRAEERPFAFHGVLSTLEIVNDLARGAVVRAVLVPRLWRLTLTRHSRVFVKQSLPAILDAVLQGAGMTPADYALELSGTYGPLEHVCQYRESSFAFLSRRMEREGVYYFFEQGDDRERLIITDDRAFHDRLSASSVRYYQVSGTGASGIEGLHAFRGTHSSIPGSVRVRDYDYLRPGLDVSGSAPVSGSGGEEVHLHGENVTTPEEGARIARVRAEELEARKLVFRGAGRSCFLRTGYTFALEDHPRPGVDGAYLVTELEHRGGGGRAEAAEPFGGDAEEGYRVDVVAIPANVQFRPERRTPVPRIYGMEGAVVDGAADSDYAQLDEHGRYLLKMRFDESAAKDGKASARVRMMQPHGGNPESFHFPLRKGTEVLLAFEGGDPDRPVIAGVVPNAVTPSLVSARNATKNILMTGGGNRLIIEDEQGKEYIHLATPHKGTYLHLGSKFNPQYNKISNTAGTSLSFTESISTSVTGTDGQTVIEDARVTIIGRSRIVADEPGGQEIATLLGSDFITRFEQEPLDRLWNEASQLLGTDAPPAATAMKNALKLLAGATVDAGQVAVYVFQLQAAINLMVQDVNVILADAGAVGNTTAVNLATALSSTLASLQTDANTAVSKVSAGDPASLTALTTLLKADNTTLGVAASASATPPVAASGVFTALTALLAAVEPPHTMAIAPSPNISASFINLPHGASLNDSGLTLEASDATAMDVTTLTGINPPPPPLNPGADIKIVGGDNVTIVAGDGRSQIEGRAYTLVLGGKASVVRGGQQSRVMAPAKSGPVEVGYALLSPPNTFQTLAYPLPPMDWGSPIAQRSEVYGDSYAWVDGRTTSTVTSGTHTAVYSPARRPAPIAPEVTHQASPAPPPHPIPTPATTSTVAQAAEVYGDQYSWVDGSVNGTVTGSKTTHVGGDQTSVIGGSVDTTVLGSQTTHVPTQVTHVTSSIKTAAATADLTAFKLAITGLTMSLNGVAIGFNALKMDITVLKLANHGINLVQATGHFSLAGLHVFD